jgi:dTDP-4-dehydrorhamnose reductase
MDSTSKAESILKQEVILILIKNHKMSEYKVLIAGAAGKVGEAISRMLKTESSIELVALTSNADYKKVYENVRTHECNLSDSKQVKTICIGEKPDFVINAVGTGPFDGCDTNKKECRELNSAVAETLVSVSKVLESHYIMYSTDFVFSGDKGPYNEDATPSPSNYFGKSKLAAENACPSNLDRYTIVRCTPIIGLSSFGKKDYATILLNNIYNKKQSEEVALDYLTNPVFVDDVALITYRIIEKKRTGIYNAGGGDWLCRNEIAKLIAKNVGIEDDFSVESAEKSTTAKTMRFGLVTLKSETELLVKPTHLENSLTTMRYHQNVRSKFRTNAIY